MPPFKCVIIYLDGFQGLTFPELELNQDYDAKMNSYNNYAHEQGF
jgi:hypothetical protein